VVEQFAVNELVVGSNPTRGANENSPNNMGLFLYLGGEFEPVILFMYEDYI
jgi:hypothetical protein